MRRLDDAAAAFGNVQLSDSPEAYTNAQFNLGNTYKLMGRQMTPFKAGEACFAR